MEYKNVLECLRKIFEESVRKKMFEKSIRNLFRVESFWEKNNFFKVVFFFFKLGMESVLGYYIFHY